MSCMFVQSMSHDRKTLINLESTNYKPTQPAKHSIKYISHYKSEQKRVIYSLTISTIFKMPGIDFT